MKLYVKYGKLYFDYEGKHSEIFTFNNYGFRYLGNGIREFVPPYDYKDGCIAPDTLNYDILIVAFRKCREAGVTVTDEAEAYVADFKARSDKQEAELVVARKLAEERERKAALWKRLKNQGCRGCEYLKKMCDDDYICKHTGDILDLKNKPKYIGNVYYLFNYVPFPCAGCMYRADDDADTKSEQTIIDSEGNYVRS